MKYPIKEHGTNTGYSYGCRCFQCRVAAARYRIDTSVRRVPLDRARAKLLSLRAAGFSKRDLAQYGIGSTMFWRIVHGGCQSIRRATEDLILSIDPRAVQHDDGAVIDGATMWRKVDALLERGYNRRTLERMLGYTMLYRRPPRVRACTAYRVSRLCEEIEAGRVRR